jgi:polysaccharide pyruvyl transferase WcaK-like protein
MEKPSMESPSVSPCYRVFLVGASLQGGNRGVRALAESLIKLIGEARPGVEVTLFSGEQVVEKPERRVADVPVRVLGFRSSPRAGRDQNLYWLFAMSLLHRLLPLPVVRRWILATHEPLRRVAEADFVGNIRGGDSFADIYGLRRFLRGTIPNLMMMAMGVDLVLLPQTYGPFRTRLARRLAGAVMGSARRIYARDAESLAVAREILESRRRAVPLFASPDVAFALDARPPADPEITPGLPDPRGLLVGLNVSGLLYIGGFNRKNMFGFRSPYDETIRLLVNRLMERPEVRLLLVPHVFGSSAETDEGACLSVFEWGNGRFPGRVHRVAAEYDQGEIKGIVGGCDFFVGSRMHACIGALSQGIPTIAIAYSRKFKGVFEVAEMGDMVVDPRELDSQQLVDACTQRLDARAQTAIALAERIPIVKQELSRCFGEMLLQGDSVRPSEHSGRRV